LTLSGPVPEYLDSAPGLSVSWLAPTQWADLHRVRYLTSEQRLYFAVLEDAIRAITKTEGLRWQARRADALAWVAGEYARITFDQACEVLNIDSSWLREALQKNQTLVVKRRSPVSGYDSVIPYQRLSRTGRVARMGR
jgi:hypothetical protein